MIRNGFDQISQVCFAHQIVGDARAFLNTNARQDFWFADIELKYYASTAPMLVVT